tara:strand:+ start:13517 stop:14167 length:651 start_codon:yes stop_codon:yes gene_type:complete
MKHKLALFDLDGVIVDTAKYHFISWRKIAKCFNYELKTEDNQKLKGLSRTDSLNQILNLANMTLDSNSFKIYLEKKNQDYLKYVRKITVDDILPGILEALHFLDKRKIKIALGSASKNARLILDQLEITSFFKIVVDGNQVKKSKPHPEVFLKASMEMGVTTKKCVVFEDSQAGIIAAKAAGMTAVAIGDKKDFANYDFCYPNFSTINTSELEMLF